ncbi:hypothetical protein MMPV_001189 [Pyropia vietnamensis]
MTTPAPAPSSLPPHATAGSAAGSAAAPPPPPATGAGLCAVPRDGDAITLCNACGVRRSKALRKKQQAAAAAAAAAAGEPPPLTGAAKKKAAASSSGAAAGGGKAAAVAATKAAGGDASAAAGSRLPSAALPRGPGGVAKKRRPRPTTHVVRAEVVVLDEARGGHAPAVIGHALLRRPAGSGLPSGGGTGMGGGGGGSGGSGVAGGRGGEPPYGPTGVWQPPSRTKGVAHGWAPADGTYSGGGHPCADGHYASATYYEDPSGVYARSYADLRTESRLHLTRRAGEEAYPPSPAAAAAFAAHDGRAYYPPLAGARAPAQGPSPPPVALSASAAARSYTHVFGGRLPASAAAYGGVYPPPSRPGRRLEAEGDVDSGVTADEGAEEEVGGRFRRSDGVGGDGGGGVGGIRGREKQRGPPPSPSLWAYPWPTGESAAAVATVDAKVDGGRPHEAVYWPRSSFAYQLRLPLNGERGLVDSPDTERLPERPTPLKSCPRKMAETQLTNFNLLVAAASQAADRDFATTRTPSPPPGRVDVRTAHKPRAPRA